MLERPNISYVTAVNAYVNVNVSEISGGNIELNAPQLGMQGKGTIASNSGSISVDASKELLLLKTAVEVALKYVLALGIKPKGISVNTKTDEQFSYNIAKGKIAKSGLGSSAALVVASIDAILKMHNVDPSKDDCLHKLAQFAHSAATGKVGSGFDIAAATYGSIFYTRYSPEIIKSLPQEYSNEDLLGLVKKKWDYSIGRFGLPSPFMLSFANFLGEAMITPKAVGSVLDFKAKQPEEYVDLIKRINSENIKAVDSLRKIKNGDQSAMASFKDAFDEGRTLTKQLGIKSNVGIEPDDCTNLIGQSKKNGAFVAKLPGAGGKDAISALSVSKTKHDKLGNFWSQNKGLKILNIQAL